MSCFAYIFVGYHLLPFPHTLRKTPSINVIDVSLALQFLSTGVARLSTNATCTIWMFVGSFTYYLGLILMAWTSFEWRIFIFLAQSFGTNRRRFLFHYMPIFGLYLYALIYYVYVNGFYPCVNQFDFSASFCGLVCYMILPSPTVLEIRMLLHQVLRNLIVQARLSRHWLQQSLECTTIEYLPHLYSLQRALFSKPYCTAARKIHAVCWMCVYLSPVTWHMVFAFFYVLPLLVRYGIRQQN